MQAHSVARGASDSAGGSPGGEHGDVQGQGLYAPSRDVLLHNTFDVLELCMCILVSCGKSRPVPDSQSPRPSAPGWSSRAGVVDEAGSARRGPDRGTSSCGGSALLYAEESRVTRDILRDMKHDVPTVSSSGSFQASLDAADVQTRKRVKDRANAVNAAHLQCVQAAQRTPEVEVLAAYSLRCALSHAATVLDRAVRSWARPSFATSREQPGQGVQSAQEELRQLLILLQRYRTRAKYSTGGVDFAWYKTCLVIAE